MTGWLRKQFGEGEAKEDIRRAGQTASQGILEGTEIAAAGEQAGAGMEAAEIQRAIDLLSQREQLPIELRDEALGALSGYYQVPGQLQAPMGQQELIDQAMASPLYREILGGRRAGEEAILRQRSATGGLRSGGSQKDLYDYNIELENRALLGSYYEAQEQDYYNLERQDLERLRRLQGVESFAALQGNEAAIAEYMASRGAVIGRGEIASTGLRGRGKTGAAMELAGSYLGEAQVGADVRGSALSSLFGVGEAAITAKYSDIRLKDDIRYLGSAHGFNFYGWTWNEEAKKLGLEGECSGLMAHEVYEVFPGAISEKDGYLQLTYSKIGVLH